MRELDFNLLLRPVRRAIRDLRKIYDECQLKGGRFGERKYLEAVYNYYRQLYGAGKARRTAKRIAAALGMSFRANRHAISAIIAASSDIDDDLRSRSSNALRYAWSQRGTWSSLGKFFKDNHGVKGCERAWRDRQRKKLNTIRGAKNVAEDDSWDND
jgi:hypothetical protein